MIRTALGLDPTGQFDSQPRLQRELDLLMPGTELVLPPGRYRLDRQSLLEDRPGVTIRGPRAAVLAKTPRPSYREGVDAVLRLVRCDGAYVSGFTVQGGTPEGATPILSNGKADGVWCDDGLAIIESSDVTVERLRIVDCGDAWLRLCGAGSSQEKALGRITARDARVIGCTFVNGYQVSTTPAGVLGYVFQANVVRGLHGSLKWASRNPGAGGLAVVANVIQGSPVNAQGAIELAGQADLVVAVNVITDCAWAVQVGVTRASELVPTPVAWANALAASNTIARCGDAPVRVRDAITGAQFLSTANLVQP